MINFVQKTSFPTCPTPWANFASRVFFGLFTLTTMAGSKVLLILMKLGNQYEMREWSSIWASVIWPTPSDSTRKDGTLNCVVLFSSAFETYLRYAKSHNLKMFIIHFWSFWCMVCGYLVKLSTRQSLFKASAC